LLAAAVQQELLKRSFDQLRRTQERLGRLPVHAGLLALLLLLPPTAAPGWLATF
jgi:hypothetical protein